MTVGGVHQIAHGVSWPFFVVTDGRSELIHRRPGGVGARLHPQLGDRNEQVATLLAARLAAEGHEEEPRIAAEGGAEEGGHAAEGHEEAA